LTVGGALSQVKLWPHPMDFAKAQIVIERRGDAEAKQILPVVWAPGARQPTEETNHVLMPGDRIIIREPAAAPPAVPPIGNLEVSHKSTPPLLPPTENAQPASATVRDHFQYQLLVVKDTSGSMSEFNSTPEDPFVALGDSAIIDAALRILMRNKLVDVLARPRLNVLAGETAELRIEPIPGRLDIELVGHKEKTGILTAFTIHLMKTGREKQFIWRPRILVNTGKTAILRCDASSADPDMKPVYIVLTPMQVR
jgi:hypothetical protein